MRKKIGKDLVFYIKNKKLTCKEKLKINKFVKKFINEYSEVIINLEKC